MDNKELWVTLSALSAAAAAAGSAVAEERAGVAASVNPAAEGRLGSGESRVLFVGSDVFRDEVIRTDAAGLAHLTFLDHSSLTVGPNSELVIDRFVYDPESDTGELTLSATKGVLRFVGGALSKKEGVKIKTPVGSLGIRGGITVVEVGGPGGGATGCFLFGLELEGTSLSGNSITVKDQEHCLELTRDGGIRRYGPISGGELEKKLAAFVGPLRPDPSGGRQAKLPTNYRGWLRQLANQDTRDQTRNDEENNARAAGGGVYGH